MQILNHPHPHLANHVKFVTFAHNKAGKSRTFTHMFMHIFSHTCRVVLNAYFQFNFNIKFMCILYQLENHFRTIAFILIDPNNILKQKLNVVGTQGATHLND